MKIEEVFQCIDEERLFGLACDLVRIPSHSGTPGQEREISGFVEALLRDWGMEVTLQETESDRFNVLAKMSGENGGRSLTLNGHLDTVPPGRGMEAPFSATIREGWLHGRGSVDMKGAVAAMMYTLYLIKRCGIVLGGDLYFTGVVGEETGGMGTRFLMRGGFRSDFAIVGEPTDLNLVTSHKGVEQLEIRLKGRAAHASMPERGTNAICAMSDFVQSVKNSLIPELRKRTQRHVGSATMSFGLIQGGEKVNMVADFCRLQIDRRWVETESRDQVLAEIEAILHRICERDPALGAEVVPLHPAEGYFGPFAIPEDHELTVRAKKALTEAGMVPKISGMQGWTDAATLMHAGIPTLLLGPGSVAQAHSDDERVELRQLVEATKCYLALTKAVCGWR
jgi:acetylornithine deacetylase/succinyl-diaminopimelate desuccinylase